MMLGPRRWDWTCRPKQAHWPTPFIGSTIMALPAQIEQPSPNKIESSAHSYDSSLREQALGHILLGQLLAFM
jgi:hypothetical protein